MAEITFDDWQKLEMVVGRIGSVEKVPNKDKIQIVSSLVDYYTAEELQGRLIIVLTNLKPARFGGEMSYGMLLCAEKDGKVILLAPEKDIGPGAVVT
jgi:methionine--tRNA ligase beta chain